MRCGYTILTGLDNGENDLKIHAKDESGNMGASEAIWFNIAESFPMALVSVASVETVTTVGAGLLVYFKKRKR